MVFQTHIGSEDCLHLNVFTPEVSECQLLMERNIPNIFIISLD